MSYLSFFFVCSLTLQAQSTNDFVFFRRVSISKSHKLWSKCAHFHFIWLLWDGPVVFIRIFIDKSEKKMTFEFSVWLRVSQSITVSILIGYRLGAIRTHIHTQSISLNFLSNFSIVCVWIIYESTKKERKKRRDNRRLLYLPCRKVECGEWQRQQ